MNIKERHELTIDARGLSVEEIIKEVENFETAW